MSAFPASWPIRSGITGRRIAILVVRAKSNRLADILPHVAECRALLASIQPGQVLRAGSV